MRSRWNAPALFGQLESGPLVTLLACYLSKYSFGMGSASPVVISANRAVIGAHLSDLDNTEVTGHTMHLSSLANWLSASPTAMRWTSDGATAGGIDVSYRHPDTVTISLPSCGFDVSIAPRVSVSTTVACACSVSWRAVLTITPHERRPYSDVADWAQQCKHLLSLLIGEPLSTREVSVIPAASPDTPAHLLYVQRGGSHRKDIHPHWMLLPYADVRERFPAMVERWFARSAQARVASNIFFGADTLESPPVDIRFLAASQAVESYHRSLGRGLYMDQERYDALVQRINTHIPDEITNDHRTSLKNRLKWGNEYSLRRRLTELFDRLPDDAAIAIGGNNPRAFVRRVVETRNYHTHHDHDARARAFDGEAMYEASQRLRILVVANLLFDLGIPPDQLLGTLRRRQDYAHWMAQGLAI